MVKLAIIKLNSTCPMIHSGIIIVDIYDNMTLYSIQWQASHGNWSCYANNTASIFEYTAKNHFLIKKKILNLRNYFLKRETDFLNKKTVLKIRNIWLARYFFLK